jgi:hypothetical protein
MRGPPELPPRNWLFIFWFRDSRHPWDPLVSARWWPVDTEFHGSKLRLYRGFAGGGRFGFGGGIVGKYYD